MIEYGVDEAGIATISFDIVGKPVNILSPEARADFVAAVDKAITDDSVTGIVITSGKADFVVGADLTFIQQFRGASVQHTTEKLSYFRDALRRLEASPKPAVAALPGTALGGGFEIALACNCRMLGVNDKAEIGLPEITLGLMPGAGGTQRLPRLIGLQRALPMLLDGNRLSGAKALELGLIDAIVPSADLLAEAKRWIAENPEAVQPWTKPDYTPPGLNPGGLDANRFFAETASRTQARTRDLVPAYKAILSAVFEGIRVPIDQGLAIELAAFVSVVRGDVAQNIVRTTFFGVADARKLAARPEGYDKAEFKKIGIIGAGLMGTGIAEAASLAGAQVVLIDQNSESAALAHGRVANSLNSQVEKGRLSETRANAALAIITATADFSELAGCDAIIEAVFEDRAVKADVTKRALEAAGDKLLFGTNTSKIPITGLAHSSSRPDRFIGLHFFSPVPRMPLLEIIRGENTSDETLANALDLAKLLGKTPIVVRDGPGFYTSRCVGTYLNEGLTLLAEGVAPAMIENCGRATGMPLGPLALADEIGLDLMHDVRVQERKDGVAKRSGPEVEALGRMVALGRRGRKAGAGLYDYTDKANKVIWAGLADAYPSRASQPDPEEVRQRLIYVQALEAARCFDEDIIDSARDADIGSILGWGFPRHTGGVISYIDTTGVAAFVENADKLAAKFGERYEAPAKLRAMAQAGERFYP